MKTIFKEGDKVFDIQYGWGIVKRIDFDANYPIFCRFDNDKQCYSIDGKIISGAIPTLSFTEYTLEGFSQERPEELPKRGDIVWIKEMDTKMYVPIIFMEAIDDNYVLSFNFMNIKIVNKDFVETKNPYANEQ